MCRFDSGESAIPAPAGGCTHSSFTKILQLLRETMADLPEAAAQRRLVTACFMFLNILIIHTRGGNDGAESFEAALGDTLDQIVLTLEAPYLSQQ